MEIVKNIGELFQIRTQAHWLHLQTDSFSEHKALNEFYEGWLDLTDSFVEKYFGKYGKHNGAFMQFTQPYGVVTPIVLMDGARASVEVLEASMAKEDTDMLNILADMKGLINETKYLLTLK
jgi:hypothetical protein